jgi:hypothetical protein
MRKLSASLFAGSALLLLSGCVTAPQGPSFEAMPPSGKSLEAFQADEDACERYAGDRVAGRVKQANDEQTTDTIIGTAIGVGVGAAVGNTRGAIVGGTAGGLIGGGANDPGWKEVSIQRQYDMAYAQCMTSKGNTVPEMGEHRGYHRYPPPGYGPPPPPGYGPPPPPPGYGPPPPPPGY